MIHSNEGNIITSTVSLHLHLTTPSYSSYPNQTSEYSFARFIYCQKLYFETSTLFHSTDYFFKSFFFNHREACYKINHNFTFDFMDCVLSLYLFKLGFVYVLEMCCWFFFSCALEVHFWEHFDGSRLWWWWLIINNIVFILNRCIWLFDPAYKPGVRKLNASFHLI